MKHNSTLLADCVLLDLETGQDGRILKIGAVRGTRTFTRSGRFDTATALAELDLFCRGSPSLVGHNLVEHDLVVLGDHLPELGLLTVPVIDTLYLSPICFPENPYHRLVKDYKLVSESRNDPLADARLAGVLLQEEIQSLRGMAEAAPDFFRCLRFLLCAGQDDVSSLTQGMKHCFLALAGDKPMPAGDEAHALLVDQLQSFACRTAAAFVTECDLSTEQARWAYAFALTWLRVAGADSVLPRWVRLRNLLVVPLLERLRETPCDSPDCQYCRMTHNPEIQLQRYFGFDGFRPTPKDADGSSLQRAIVLAGMRNESVLAIMPTGGGKSLCFQLPAMVRNFRRGQLTVVVSPLQALMKDQVDGLARRTGIQSAAALSGLLTPPERGTILRGISTGSISLLYVSPEQLRSSAVKRAILQREIGCWVLDEAHCLSKWGHDFRPDYLYVGRFIRELAVAQGSTLPPVACFTATAKRDVIDEIVYYFRRETGTELIRYEGGVERDNLRFEVQLVGAHAKLPRIHELLTERMPLNGAGSAVVFRATRRHAEETAEFLGGQGWAAACFHAKMTVSDKKRIQNAFLAGNKRVICATNAFGMGIDKDDVRIVIHGDTPGSLENYLQEAGRAGRDRQPADCVLLYDEEDCEQQFRIGARSELSRRDIAQILRGLRKAANSRKTDEVIITTGELLRDEDVETEFDVHDHSADTKVRSAVSWLERAGFIERNENRTNVIQARLLVHDLAEARERLAKLNLSEREKSLWLAIIREMINADETDILSVDEIALLPSFQSYLKHTQFEGAEGMVREPRGQEYLSAKVLKVLDSMMAVGVLKKDTLLTAYIRYKVGDHSSLRLARVLSVDREFLKLLAEEAPDPEGWLSLNLRLVNDSLLSRGVECSPEMLRQLLRSLGEDGRGFAGQSGSIDCRHVGHDMYRVRVRREWRQVAALAEMRNRVASLILETLIGSIPPETPPKAELLVDFSFEKIRSALEQDLTLRSDLRDAQAAIERGLMFLHEQNVIILQKGLAIFRSAMTIRVLPQARGQRYTAEQYDALQHHYRERIFQVHVMNEYARYGMQRIKAAIELVVAYFTMEKEAFILRFFSNDRTLLERATTARSYRAIVDSLGNRDQIRIVTQPVEKNLLILAGPGSGKTRVVVHRCAYLLRVKRVQPRAVLICCFNHKAALELRRRLADLVGRDAVGVTIQTYHGLALRILGRSCRGLEEQQDATPDFDRLIKDAVNVLRGQAAVPGIEPDEIRDRLLAGFKHILVDEYQDIDEPQYQLIEAIAGRTLNDDDRKLSILAVGDDDQGIYGFRGANVAFIRRFRKDYKADVAWLVENYRSTRNIIAAANRLIAHNRDRMKTDKPIRIDQGRKTVPAGGEFGQRDPLTRGRVAVIEVADGAAQAAAIVREIARLHELGVSQWGDMAVLSRTRQDLALVRAAAEARGIPVAWPLERNKIPPLHRIREFAGALGLLAKEGGEAARASEIILRVKAYGGKRQDNPWSRMLEQLLEAWRIETGDEPTPVNACTDFLYESLMQRHHDEQFGEGIVLSTIHAAKGTEYAHVMICGDWSAGYQANREEERRVLFVGMTRARETLSIFNRMDRKHPFLHDLAGPCFTPRRETLPSAQVGKVHDYALLGLEDIFLDFAGRRSVHDSIHVALAGLECGAVLSMKLNGERIQLVTPGGCPVARLSAAATQAWKNRLDTVEEVRVLCNLVRYATDSKEPDFQSKLKSPSWEIPTCEIVFHQK